MRRFTATVLGSIPESADTIELSTYITDWTNRSNGLSYLKTIDTFLHLIFVVWNKVRICSTFSSTAIAATFFPLFTRPSSLRHLLLTGLVRHMHTISLQQEGGLCQFKTSDSTVSEDAGTDRTQDCCNFGTGSQTLYPLGSISSHLWIRYSREWTRSL
jgi:hypothetical protein